MDKLTLLQYLNSEGIKNLEINFNIKVKQHPKYPELHLLKYDQIKSPMQFPLAQECRGCIVRIENGEWQFVSRPFDKFFNLKEKLAHNLDWETATVNEKLDGSLMILYMHDGSWQVSSSGLPDASGKVNNDIENISFSDLFWKTWRDSGYLLSVLDPTFTYMFELCTIKNKVVVKHEKPRLVLIGARQTRSGQEINPNTLSTFFEVAKTFPIKQEKCIFEKLDEMNGSEFEGFVVCDKNYNRVKVKHPDYVKIHLSGTEMNYKKMLNLFLVNEHEEVLAYFPEYKSILEEIKQNIFQKSHLINTEFSQIKAETQKEFAEQAVKSKFSSVLFSMKKEKKDASKILIKLPLNKLMEVLSK